MTIEVGDVFRDNDSRGPARYMRVIAITQETSGSGFAWMQNTETGRKTRISLKRLRSRGNRGYWPMRDAPETVCTMHEWRCWKCGVVLP